VVLPAFSKADSAVTSASAAPRISFTFDDGITSAYTQAAPILAKYNLSGTAYIITNCVGMTTTPNTCPANTANPYMTWQQIQALQSTYGWEIGSHTVDHQCLASNAKIDPGDCQTNTLTLAQVDAELANSKSALAAHGITATDFSPPYGDYNNAVLAEIAKYYGSMRNFANVNNNANVWPYSDYYLEDVTVQEGTNTVASIKAQIDNAISRNQWLILTFHDIETTPSKNADDYQYGSSELDQIAAYVASKQSAGSIKNVHINQGLVTSTTNLVANSSFNSGIASGWTTDTASIVADAGNHGSYPDPTNAVKLTSSTTAGHLFSPKVAVDPGTTYMFKSFLNVQSITSGEVGFYIDEYDANGNWISGQWKTAEKSSFVENMNFTYKPSSVTVSKAALQVYITANSGITAYLDNVQWFPLVMTSKVSLMPNGGFDAGLTNGWTTDDTTNITADSANHGSPSDPTNAVSLVSNATTGKNGHLFSPRITVSPTNTYTVSSWLNLMQINNTSGGEVGFYIDEYDANGNWISGQYKTGVHTTGTGTVGFTYTPSSSSVQQASLQVIVVGNSGIQAYLDDVIWSQN
jgi:peptidoglycan/xylan/chitin deacetylase (PgdA/CDA1 family)